MSQSIYSLNSIPKEDIVSSICFNEKSIEIMPQSGTKSDIGYKIIFYDKKNDRIIYQNTPQIYGNRIIIPVDTIETNGIDTLSYVRIAILYDENTIGVGFIKSNESDDECNKRYQIIRQIEEKVYLLYFSKKKILSLKCMDNAEFIREYSLFHVHNFSCMDGKIIFNIQSRIVNEGIYDFSIISHDKKRIVLNNSNRRIEEKGECTCILELDMSLADNIEYGSYILEAEYAGIRIPIQTDIEISDRYKGYNLSLSNREGRAVFNISGNKYEYLITIVMAVFNTEEYVVDAVNSILNQKITSSLKQCSGQVSEKLCQIILVDDGSTDSSGKLCDELAENNEDIVVIHQNNRGVSAARNAGIKIAGGKYINFMDSDDMITENVFSECIPYFEKHYNSIHMIAFPMFFFDGRSGPHWLNDKFKNGKRIINLLCDYEYSVISTSSGIFKTEMVKDIRTFDEELVTGEDIKFIYSLLIDNSPEIGLVDSCRYMYRRRTGKEKSAIQNQRLISQNYFPYIEHVMKWIFNKAENKYGSIPLYIQNMCAQQLQYRFIKGHDEYEIAGSIMTEEQIIEYRDSFFEIFNLIDDNIIMNQKKMYSEHKKYLMEKKYGKCLKQFTEHGLCYYIAGRIVAREENAYVMIDSLIYKDDEIIVEGYYRTFENEITPYVRINEMMMRIDSYHTVNDTFLFEESIYSAVRFSFSYDVSIGEVICIKFFEISDGKLIEKNKLRTLEEGIHLNTEINGNTLIINTGDIKDG